MDSGGRVLMECVLATRAGAILDFVRGLRGTVHLTWEEGTHSAWLYSLLIRRVARWVVCNPRKKALLKAGNKSEAIDARKLAELLRGGQLSAVYHDEHAVTAVQELGRSYTTLTEDTMRVMGRVGENEHCSTKSCLPRDSRRVYCSGSYPQRVLASELPGMKWPNRMVPKRAEFSGSSKLWG